MTTTWVGNRNVLVATDAIIQVLAALYTTLLRTNEPMQERIYERINLWCAFNNTW